MPQMNMLTALENAYDAEKFRETAHQIVDFLADQLQESLAGNQDQVLPWTDPNTALEEVVSWIARGSNPASWNKLEVQQLFKQVFSRCIRLHDPRYMGHQISPPLPITAIAGLMADLLNNGMGVFEMGIAGTAMERFVIKSIAEQFGMGPQADGVLTSGGTLGNLTALLAARSANASQDVWREGSEQPLAVLVSQQAHYCIDRAARIMGWGEQGVIQVPTDNAFRLRVDALEDCLAEATNRGRQVVAVVGSACSTATGSFDDLRSLANFCRQHEIWFHVDGADGAAAAYSEKYRQLVAGIDLADSVTLDFHKLLMTPALATAVIFRNGEAGTTVFSQRADYLWREQATEQQDEPWYDLARRTFECTKTMTSLKIFSILAVHGSEVFADNVTRLFDSAREFADFIEAAPDFELACRPESNIVCYRYIGTTKPESKLAEETQEKKLDELNLWLRQQVVEAGEFYIVQTNLNGRQWLRSTIANPFTTPAQMKSLLDHIRSFRETAPAHS